MGDYFFMFLIISNTVISINNSIIYSIKQHPLIEVSEVAAALFSAV